MKSKLAPSLKTIRALAGNCTVAVALALVLLLAANQSWARGRVPNPKVLPAGSTAFGRTYGDWSAEWWNWALQLPLEQNPMADPTGAFGRAGQKGPVWFLAGTFGGAAERSLTVPRGKAIFFPLFSILNACPDPSFQQGPGQTLEQFLTQGAEAFIDMASDLFAEVDGMPVHDLWEYRVHSNLVMLSGHPSLVGYDPCLTGEPQPAVAAGYWLMLAPLKRGQHTIRFGSTARFGNSEFNVDVTYHLTVD